MVVLFLVFIIYNVDKKLLNREKSKNSEHVKIHHEVEKYIDFSLS